MCLVMAKCFFAIEQDDKAEHADERKFSVIFDLKRNIVVDI